MRRQGFSTALAGNTLLLSYFLGKGERAAATVQTIGAVSNFVMLTQVLRPCDACRMSLYQQQRYQLSCQPCWAVREQCRP